VLLLKACQGKFLALGRNEGTLFDFQSDLKTRPNGQRANGLPMGMLMNRRDFSYIMAGTVTSTLLHASLLVQQSFLATAAHETTYTDPSMRPAKRRGWV